MRLIYDCTSVTLNKKNPHKFIEIKRGRLNNNYRFRENHLGGRVYEGEDSLKFLCDKKTNYYSKFKNFDGELVLHELARCQ